MKTGQTCPICKTEIEVSSFNNKGSAYSCCSKCGMRFRLKFTSLSVFTEAEMLGLARCYGKDIADMVKKFNDAGQPREDIYTLVDDLQANLKLLNEYLSDLYEMRVG